MHEQVAIVGVSFRFPGKHETLDSFWNSLVGECDLVSNVPASRWATGLFAHPDRAEPGRSVTFKAAVLDQIDQFDADFFGISPREAAKLDPQQRLLLELAWHVLEDAGETGQLIRGQNCGVYVGASSIEYSTRSMDDISSLSAHSMTGGVLSMVANRLSHVLDLHGPSMAVDTACSSSLVAMNTACDSIRHGEISTALVGGISLLLHPHPFVGFSKASMLSANGRSRSFSKDADGYVRAEGGSLFLLKPLSKALEDGDRIHAVIRGSGVNTDGARKNGLTIPSNVAQAELFQRVLDRSGLAADDVDYVEAHGTGTSVGDPIEVSAIGAVYGVGRKNGLLPIGSVKSNLGHMEPASGMAGLIKALLVLKNEAIPASLHSEVLNPALELTRNNIEVVRDLKPLTPKDKPYIVAVNSFGFGGANAHVLLEQAPVTTASLSENNNCESALPLVFSAKCPEALASLAEQYAALTRVKSDVANDIAASAVWSRAEMPHRLLVRASSADVLAEKLEVFAADPTADIEGVSYVEASQNVHKIGFVYSGNGAQWAGMGRALLEQSPAFSAVIESIDRIASQYLDYSIKALLREPDANHPLEDTAVAQPLLFAIQVGMTKLLESQGITPDCVMGHSVGEVAAAWASGALDLEQATKLSCIRSALQAKTHDQGRMMAVNLEPDAAWEAISVLGLEQNWVEVAAQNAPQQITLAGEADALDKLAAYLEAKGVFARVLDLKYAFHSRAMEPIEKSVYSALADLTPSACNRSFVSAITGAECDGTALDADYWWKNVRHQVQFEKATEQVIALGCDLLVEIGPNAILHRYLQQTAKAKNASVAILVAAKRDQDDLAYLNRIGDQCKLYLGYQAFKADLERPKQFIDLPKYPFVRQRYWNDPSPESLRLISRDRVHPLLGYPLVENPGQWENSLDATLVGYLADHKVGSIAIMPAAGFAEMALAAAFELAESSDERARELDELEIFQPMLFEQGHSRLTRLVFDPLLNTFFIKSRPRLSDETWTVHAKGKLRVERQSSPEPQLKVTVSERGHTFDKVQHYHFAKALGLEYGLAFQGVEEVHVERDAFVAKIKPASAVTKDADHQFHPAVMDLAFQGLLAVVHAYEPDPMPLLPVQIGRCALFGKAADVCLIRGKITARTPHAAKADFELLDGVGQLVARLTDCRFRLSMLDQAALPPAKWQTQWHRTEIATLPRADVDLNTTQQAITNGLSALTQEHARVEFLTQQRPLLDALITSMIQHLDQKLIHQQPLAGRLHWLMALLSEQGALDDKAPSPELIWQALYQNQPQLLPELLLLGRAGKNLQGDESSKTTDSGHWTAFEQDSLTYQTIHRALVSVCKKHLASWRSARKMRVLLLGDHSIGLEAQIKAHLADAQLTQAAISMEGHSELKRQLKQQPGVSLVLLDTQTGFWEQEGSSHPYDLVLVPPAALYQLSDLAINTIIGSLAGSGQIVLSGMELTPSYVAMHLGHDGFWFEDTTGVSEPVQRDVSYYQKLVKAYDYSTIGPIYEPDDVHHQGGWLIAAQKSNSISPELAAQHANVWLIGERSNPDLKAIEEVLFDHGFSVSLLVIGEQKTPVDVFKQALNTSAAPEFLIWAALSPAKHTDPAFEALTKTVAGNELAQCVSVLSRPPRMFWITSDALPVVANEKTAINPVSGALWGLGRVLLNEHAGLDLCLLAAENQPDWAQLPSLLMQADDEREFLLSNHHVSVPRVVERKVRTEKTGECFQLGFSVPGQLRNLKWQSVSCADVLDAQSVEVVVQAAGLNFRDVMYAMGLLSDEALENGFSGPGLGLEFSGVVTRVGSAVSRFKTGDKVMGFGPKSLASHVVTDQYALAEKPEQWSHAQAATVPTVFFTVYYALEYLARLEAGERVLIHGGAGGVGIAAILLAQHLGAEIHATAGSEEKREFLKWMGVEYIYDSRSLKFADQIMVATEGEGVDVVLNSLAGEAIERNLMVLKPFGRFLELGKRDFYENNPMQLRPFKDNLSYFGIDADQLMKVRPELTQKLFTRMMRLFADEKLVPLPVRLFSADSVVEAFRYMQKARQIGKVVVDLSQPPQTIVANVNISGFKLNAQRSYLVTGGTGGFGWETALWLLEQGAGQVVLISRRGAQTSGLAARIQALPDNQAERILVESADVADGQAITRLIEKLQQSAYPLAGVVHAAMVLDDGLAVDLDAKRFKQVFEPKVRGAQVLDQATRGLELDLFVAYSSATTLIGNPGQANYVAANAYLELLMQQRRKAGLPGTAVCWGPIGDAGYLTEHEAIRAGLESRIGGKPLTASQALDALAEILSDGDSQVTVMNMQWSVLAGHLPAASGPVFDILAQTSLPLERHGDSDNIIAELKILDEAQALALLRQYLSEEVAGVLGSTAEMLNQERSLMEMGLDSLMGVELGAALEKRLGVAIPAMVLNEGPSISRLSERIYQQIVFEQDAAPEERVEEALFARHEGQAQSMVSEGGNERS